MHGYRYQPGDTPLAGYTIQSAAGRGGFGEVYYAVSDSGREVALKALMGHTQIELRGISQCMNLKSPHLVSIFDVLYADHGDPFVLMEYIQGPSLQQIIEQASVSAEAAAVGVVGVVLASHGKGDVESGVSAATDLEDGRQESGQEGRQEEFGGSDETSFKGGLGVAKTAFFLREIAKGLSYLHDCGIVHRDLKPANIFYENGYVKIGDYGLSKAMSASMNQSHTVTVGSVHYMAPEVGAGQYNRSIDIYALGCLVYEMLTGKTPYHGQSPAEVLMKHMSEAPDLTGVPEPFASVIAKAMAKDPADRYRTVQEIVEAVFGEDHVRNSVSHFNDAELSVYAQRLHQKLTVDRNQSDSNTKLKHEPAIGRISSKIHNQEYLGAESSFGAGQEFDTLQSHSASDSLIYVVDPLPHKVRLLFAAALSLLAMFAIVILVAATGGTQSSADSAVILSAVVYLGGILGLKVYWNQIAPRMVNSSSNHRHFLSSLMLVGGSLAGMLLVEIWGISPGPMGFVWFVCMSSLAWMNWSDLTNTKREKRLSLKPIGIAAAVALGLEIVLGKNMTHLFPGVGPAIAANMILIAQVYFQWQPRQKVSKSNNELKDLNLTLDIDQQSTDSVHAAAIHREIERDAAGHNIQSQTLNESKGDQQASVDVDHNQVRSSTKNRTVCLVLSILPAVLTPVCGLHRLYSGRIGSGLLWLFTFGLLGVGQIVDLVLIACGDFKDGSDKPIRYWQDAPARARMELEEKLKTNGSESTQKLVDSYDDKPLLQGLNGSFNQDHQSLYKTVGISFSSLLATTIGSVAMMLALFISVLVGLRVPEALALGMFGSNLAHDLTQVFGYEQWGGLVRMFGQISGLGLLMLGFFACVWARRQQGVFHILRMVVAGVFFLITTCLMQYLIDQWVWNTIEPKIIVDLNSNPAESLHVLMSSVVEKNLFTGLVFFVVSVLLIVIPVRKQKIA